MDFIHEQLPGRIVFGAGRRHDLSDEIARFDPASLLIIGGSHEAATMASFRDALAVAVETIVGVRAHVPEADVRAALEIVDGFAPDVVVTVGGGSATGLGKMIALERDVTLIAVPTTYAGSEMTPIWGTTSGGVKSTGRALRVLPATVVYDPELTVGLPTAVTVNSAFNAVAHGAEALWLPGTSPIAAETAIGAIRSIVAAVADVVADLGDIDARAELLYGAHRAGTVLAVAGTGLLHQTAHVLGGMFGVDHGALYAVLTPVMIDHHLSTVPGAAEGLFPAFGSDPGGELTRLAEELGAPRSLTEIGVPAGRTGDAIDAIARHAGADRNTVASLVDAAMSPTT